MQWPNWPKRPLNHWLHIVAIKIGRNGCEAAEGLQKTLLITIPEGKSSGAPLKEILEDGSEEANALQ